MFSFLRNRLAAVRAALREPVAASAAYGSWVSTRLKARSADLTGSLGAQVIQTQLREICHRLLVIAHVKTKFHGAVSELRVFPAA